MNRFFQIAAIGVVAFSLSAIQRSRSIPTSTHLRS